MQVPTDRRAAELASIQIRDFDAERGVLRVRGKGQKERLLPLRGPDPGGAAVSALDRAPARCGFKKGTTTCSTRFVRFRRVEASRVSSS